MTDDQKRRADGEKDSSFLNAIDALLAKKAII
ncbi:hypothetical protein SCB49_09900 [unidentified eubacterium SCB49]|nr:hypothetical protein SCB49_09900 [unidentified eubacterium SCB49]